MSSTPDSNAEPGLASLPVRLAVFAAMAAIAVAATLLIDHRAMQIQAQHGWSYHPAEP